MGRRRRASDRPDRAAMRSPVRPPAGRRERRVRFWVAIARGLSSEDAAVRAGVSPAVGVRWFREGGGCRGSPWARRRGDVCPLPSARRSLCCAPSARRARDRAAAWSFTVDDLQGAAAQRRDSQRRVRVSRQHRAVACRSACAAPETGPARRQRPAALVCARPPGRRGAASRRRRRRRPEGELEGAA